MKEIKLINIPKNYKIDKIQNTDDILVISFKEEERELPKTWERFCKISPNIEQEFYISSHSSINIYTPRAAGSDHVRHKNLDANLLPDLKTAVAMLTLCKLIQLRNYYNEDWIPNWTECKCNKYMIDFDANEITTSRRQNVSSSPLYFKTEELRDEFLRNFRPLIEKLKPLYGIKEGGEE